MCFPCAAMVAKQMPNKCPLCRVPIRYVARITTAPFALKDGRTLAVSGEVYAVRTDVVSAFINATARRRSAGDAGARARPREVVNNDAQMPIPPLVSPPVEPPLAPPTAPLNSEGDPALALVL